MKERNKKSKISILLFFVLIFSIVLLFGCDGCNDEMEETLDHETIPAEFSLNYSTKEIKQFENFQLMVEYNVVPNVELVFSSTDSKVVTVSEMGNVVGVGIGQATIDVVYGNQKASCSVTVSENTFMPNFQFSNLSLDKELIVRETESVHLDGYVLYNKTPYEDFEIDYKYDQNLGSITDNVYASKALAGVAEQTTSITVIVTWHGITVESAPSLTKTLNLKIVKRTEIDDDRILINDSSSYPENIVLYTTHDAEGQSFETSYDFVCRTVKNGVVSSDASKLDIEIDGDCIQKAGEKLVAAKAGTAVVNVKYNQPTSSVEALTNVTINVEVKYPKLEQAKLENQSALDGISLPNNGKEIKKVLQLNGSDAKELTVTGNITDGYTVTDLVTEPSKITETTIEVYYEKYARVYDIEAYTKIIKTEADLEVIKTDLNELVTGYYLLGNDLTITNKWEATIPNVSFSQRTTGFNGVFDGAGHTLTVNELGKNGIFGCINTSGIVKNTHFVINSIVSNEAERCNALAYSMQTTSKVDNTVIEVLPDAEHKIENFKGVCYAIIYQSSFTNSIVRINENVSLDVNSNGYCGLLMTYDAGYLYSHATNVVVISPTETRLSAYMHKNVNYLVYAKNDTTSGLTGIYASGYELKPATEVNIFKDISSAVESKATIGNWTMKQDGTFVFAE